MNAKISELFKIDSEVIPCTSSLGATSQPYSMKEYDRVFIAANLAGSFTTARVDLMQSTAATFAMTSAAAGTTGREIGGVATNIDASGGVRAMILTFASATGTTDAVKFQLGLGTNVKTFCYTTSSAYQTIGKSSMMTSTKLFFGSSIGSTVNTGLTAMVDNFIGWLGNTTFGFGAKIRVRSTPTTDSVQLTVADEDDGPIMFNTTNDFYTVNITQAAAGFDVRANDLSSGNAWVGVKVSTATTGNHAAITVIRGSGRYAPPTFAGKMTTA